MYEGIEMVMQAISVGSVKSGVESVVASLVSHHEIGYILDLIAMPTN